MEGERERASVATRGASLLAKNKNACIDGEHQYFFLLKLPYNDNQALSRPGRGACVRGGCGTGREKARASLGF